MLNATPIPVPLLPPSRHSLQLPPYFVHRASVWVRASDLILALVQLAGFLCPSLAPICFHRSNPLEEGPDTEFGGKIFIGINTSERKVNKAKAERTKANDERGLTESLPVTQTFPERWLLEFPYWDFIPQSTYPTPSRSVKKHDFREMKGIWPDFKNRL